MVIQDSPDWKPSSAQPLVERLLAVQRDAPLLVVVGQVVRGRPGPAAPRAAIRAEDRVTHRRSPARSSCACCTPQLGQPRAQLVDLGAQPGHHPVHFGHLVAAQHRLEPHGRARRHRPAHRRAAGSASRRAATAAAPRRDRTRRTRAGRSRRRRESSRRGRSARCPQPRWWHVGCQVARKGRVSTLIRVRPLMRVVVLTRSCSRSSDDARAGLLGVRVGDGVDAGLIVLMRLRERPHSPRPRLGAPMPVRALIRVRVLMRIRVLTCGPGLRAWVGGRR